SCEAWPEESTPSSFFTHAVQPEFLLQPVQSLPSGEAHVESQLVDLGVRGRRGRGCWRYRIPDDARQTRRWVGRLIGAGRVGGRGKDRRAVSRHVGVWPAA